MRRLPAAFSAGAELYRFETGMSQNNAPCYGGGRVEASEGVGVQLSGTCRLRFGSGAMGVGCVDPPAKVAACYRVPNGP